ncbi:MoxR family ATPase [soil metagenome]
MTIATDRPGDPYSVAAAASSIAQMASDILDRVDMVLVGKRDVAQLLLAAMLAEGHVLIEDVPGVGKTTLARTLAQALGGEFRRIQFTPDLLPSDITGLTFFDQRQSDFRFRPGPVFANVVVADEINRATPRTQSALLEAMEERTVTVEGDTMALPRPFVVIATENPIELEGTFPLPEAQIDRFMLRMAIGYPSESEEVEIISRSSRPAQHVDPVTSPDQVREMIAAVREIHLCEDIRRYVAQIVRATREHEVVELGASPRASIALARASQALAAIHGRSEVLPDDVKSLTAPVLEHRIMLSPDSRLRGRSVSAILAEVLATVPVPVEGAIGVPTG